MHGDHAIPFLGGDFLDGLHGSIVAGIIHQHIDRTELLARRGNDVRALGFARDIGGHMRRSAAGVGDFGHDGAKLGFRARCDQYGRAFRGEAPGDGASDGAPAAGNDGDFSIQ